MASITNTSSHRIDIADLSLAPGEAIEHFDDADAERLKSSMFFKAGWLRIEPTPEPVAPE